MLLKNKTVLITGGSGGIGFTLAKALIAKGALVYSFDIHKPKERMVNFTHIIVDITQPAQIKRGFQKIKSPIDILINNAGIMRRGEIFESSVEDFDALFAIHVRGSWLMLKYGASHMNKKPIIVQMSSRHGQLLTVDPALYGLAKRWVKDVAELAQITYPTWKVNVVCPGPIDTPLTWTGVSTKELPKKRKLVRPPEHLVQKIITMLEQDKRGIVFDPKRWDEVIV